jgi:arsenate reductase (thioredoxin)
MKFFGKSKDSYRQRDSVMFVCVENAGRSQMAEGFFRRCSLEGYEPFEVTQ